MSKAAIIVCRDDNYGDNLHHRAKICLTNLTQVFDKVYVVDWKCVNNISLVEAININNPNIINIKVTKEFIKEHLPQHYNLPLIETIGRNIGIRRAIKDGIDWICSTNIDILSDTFDESLLDKETLYTVRKYSVEEHIHLQNSINIEFLKQQRNTFEYAQLSVINGQSVWDPGDIWSLVVGCGDFQLAHASLWKDIKGFEEEAVGRAYADSNLMKRPILLGKKTSILNLDIFHLNHTSNSYRDIDDTGIPLNDRVKYVNNFEKTTNTENWGMSNLI